MAVPGGEVITLQLGHYAHSVGAHWWGLQESQFGHSDSEIRSDVLFRTGLTPNGVETYTPRLIALDTKGSATAARADDGLYEDERSANAIPAWTGNVTKHEEEWSQRSPVSSTQEGGVVDEGPGRKSDLRGRRTTLESRQKTCQAVARDGVWSDYLSSPLHPKSLCLLSHRSHGGNTGGLESFSQGESLLKASSHLDEVEDRLHFFSEECDYLQGFHILCDIHSGFSGAGARIAELLHDEFPGRGILSFGTCPVPPEERNLQTSTYQLMNCVLSLVPLTNHSSIFSPLSVNSSLGRRPGSPTHFPQLLYDASWAYHSSAVLALALDTLTTPYRMSSSSLSLSHLAETLSFGGRKVMTVSCDIPFPLGSSSFLPDTLLSDHSSPPWRSLSACTGQAPIFSQSVVLRGIPKGRQSSHLPGGRPPPSPLHACTSGTDVLQCYLSSVYPGSPSISHLLSTPCRPGPTFPQFFSRYITKDGWTVEEPQAEAPVVGQIPVLAALQASSSLQQSLRGLCDEVTTIDIRRWANFSTAGVEEEDFREAVNELRCLSQCYRVRDGEDSDDNSD
ncbi:protein misato homolog 1 [Hyperolius riggenbachi]|uniref:protein misato homolog 1 n=1 Tax=Hyperolius riggenbachi TaxID=752182 RepID=UPI0035A3098F